MLRSAAWLPGSRSGLVAVVAAHALLVVGRMPCLRYPHAGGRQPAAPLASTVPHAPLSWQACLEPTSQIVGLARTAGFTNVHDYLVGGAGARAGQACVALMGRRAPQARAPCSFARWQLQGAGAGCCGA